MGDYRTELKDALEGRRRHPDELTVLAAEVRALAAQGRLADIRERLTEAPSLPPQPGWSPADIGLLAAFELAAHDHRADAPTSSQWAVRWLEGRPAAEGRTVANRFRLAIAHYLSGELPETRRILEGLVSGKTVVAADSASLRWFSAITGDMPDHLTFLGFLGVVAAREGKRDDALRIERELQAANPHYLYGRHTMWRARIRAVIGDRDTAVALVQEAFAQGYARGGVMHLYPSLASLRNDAEYQELLKPKE
jgi:tetratricopeptide (TPR) repeat protein